MCLNVVTRRIMCIDSHPGSVLTNRLRCCYRFLIFFFNDTATTEIYTLSLHDALPISEVDLVHQQTQNQRYGSSHIGATAKDISNVVTDAASGVVDIFHGIDKAVADTWNNFWKDGKADGIGSNLSRK